MEIFCTVDNGSSYNDGFPEEPTKIVISALVALFLVIGSTGNIITTIVITKNKHLQTPSNFFIVSLCLSDLISALICSPLWLYRRTWGFKKWEWGEGLCKFYWFSDFATNYVTSTHILSFAILRCFAVHFPFKMSIFTKRRVLIYIIILWAIAIAMSIPLFWLMGVVYGRELQKYGAYWPSCSIYNNENCPKKDEEAPCCVNQYNIYMLAVSSLFFYAPEVCVVVLSFLISRELIMRKRWRERSSNLYSISAQCHSCVRNNNRDVIPNRLSNGSEIGAVGLANPPTPVLESQFVNEQQRANGRTVHRGFHALSESNVFTQLGLIVITFMIGYIPLTVYLVWTTATNSIDSTNAETDYWFGVLSYLCLRLSECMNPLMYNLGSSNIRKASKELFFKRS